MFGAPPEVGGAKLVAPRAARLVQPPVTQSRKLFTTAVTRSVTSRSTSTDFDV